MNAALTFKLPDLDWFAEQADAYNLGTADADALLPQLGSRGLLRIGVPVGRGGVGGSTFDAVEAIAAVAERSLAAAFVFWGQRTFIEYLLQSPNRGLRERWLPALLDGTMAGATGLSNAMKFLSGIESLQITARAQADGWRLDGRLPWVTNLRHAGFVVAAAVQVEGDKPAIVALSTEQPGVQRNPDLELVAQRGSNTAAIDIVDVRIGPEDIIHEDARSFCPSVRPAFLSLQLGMSIGLARAALSSARAQSDGPHAILKPRIESLAAAFERQLDLLREGLASGRFVADAASLFRIRIELAGIVQQALNLELEASGGRAYLAEHNRGFARRWLEGAFIPVITPSLTQLEGELARQAAACCT